MKKLGIFVLLMGLLNLAYAQNTSIGLRVGVNAANINGDGTNGFKTRIAPNFGAFLTYSIQENFALTGEINFDSKGAKIETPDGSTSIDYLNIPVYANYIFGTGESSVRPKIFAGPTFGILMNAKTKIDGADDVDIKDNLEGFDLGAVFGLGLHKRVGDGNWLIFDARYNLGLSNILGDNAADFNQKNGVFSFNVGFSFPLGDY